ncbi:hypothetical protein [Streptomyces phaeochromogenes]|uniref:hypothetical protein n=1 Tax=Streptomyces phaeochromogenes TaxID=1923 RepID=UPI003F4D535C
MALETYLDRHVDGPCAPVLRAAGEALWPLPEAQHALALDALAWQVVRTQAFRSFDEQVGRHLFPALWAMGAVEHCEERLERPLSQAERTEVFWTALRTAHGPSVIGDPRSALRTSIRAFERTRDLLAAPGRRVVQLRSSEPGNWLVLLRVRRRLPSGCPEGSATSDDTSRCDDGLEVLQRVERPVHGRKPRIDDEVELLQGAESRQPHVRGDRLGWCASCISAVRHRGDDCQAE